MTRSLCQTVDDAWQAGWEELCPHEQDPTACESCRLRPDEIARLSVLLGGITAAQESETPVAA